MKDLLICIIFFNEKINIYKAINQIKKKNVNFLLIDDGSNDGSSENLKKKYKKKVITHKYNKGYGAVVKTAFFYAKKKNYKYLAIFPGDNQRKYKDIKKMYKLIKKKNYDYIVGSKFHLLTKIPLRRKIGNVFFSKLSNFWGNKNKDILSGFKIYNINRCYNVTKFCPNDYSFDLVFNYLSSYNKLNYTETKVFCNYKNQTSKMNNLLFIAWSMIISLLKSKLSIGKCIDVQK